MILVSSWEWEVRLPYSTIILIPLLPYLITLQKIKSYHFLFLHFCSEMTEKKWNRLLAQVVKNFLLRFSTIHSCITSFLQFTIYNSVRVGSVQHMSGYLSSRRLRHFRVYIFTILHTPDVFRINKLPILLIF